MQLGRDVSGEVRVPRVTVHEIGPGDVTDHRQVGAEGLHSGVRAGQLGGTAVRRRRPLVTRRAEGADFDIDAQTQCGDEFSDVDTGPAVDLRRVFLRDHVDAHV